MKIYLPYKNIKEMTQDLQNGEYTYSIKIIKKNNEIKVADQMLVLGNSQNWDKCFETPRKIDLTGGTNLMH